MFRPVRLSDAILFAVSLALAPVVPSAAVTLSYDEYAALRHRAVASPCDVDCEAALAVLPSIAGRLAATPPEGTEVAARHVTPTVMASTGQAPHGRTGWPRIETRALPAASHHPRRPPHHPEPTGSAARSPVLPSGSTAVASAGPGLPGTAAGPAAGPIAVETPVPNALAALVSSLVLLLLLKARRRHRERRLTT